MVQDDHTVETSRHCLVSRNVFLMEQWQRVVGVSRIWFEKSFLSDFDEATIDCMADWHGMPVLDLTGQKVSRANSVLILVTGIAQTTSRRERCEWRRQCGGGLRISTP